MEVQTRGGGALLQADSQAHGGTWSGSGCILEVEVVGFVDILIWDQAREQSKTTIGVLAYVST